MLGTISRAAGISATAPGSRNPVCMSTTKSAVLRGSMVTKGCTRPRRRIEMSIACCAISILCIGFGLLLSESVVGDGECQLDGPRLHCRFRLCALDKAQETLRASMLRPLDDVGG